MMTNKKCRFAAVLLALFLCASVLSGTAFAIDPNEVVIPEYTTADYSTDFKTTLDAIDNLKVPCTEQGSVVELSYTAPAYAVNMLLDKDATIDKTVQVYLPYGYDEAKQYSLKFWKTRPAS